MLSRLAFTLEIRMSIVDFSEHLFASGKHNSVIFHVEWFDAVDFIQHIPTHLLAPVHDGLVNFMYKKD